MHNEEMTQNRLVARPVSGRLVKMICSASPASWKGEELLGSWERIRQCDLFVMKLVIIVK
jgi:hypothetical protein